MSGAGVGESKAERFRLGDRWITPDANDIDGTRIEAKSMDVLVALVDAAPSVMSSAALLERVWPDVVVVDNVVYQAVAQLRKALGDDSHSPRYIENIPRRGYRLIARVERAVPGIGIRATNGSSPTASIAPCAVPETVAGKPLDRRWSRIVAFATVVFVLASLAFSNRTDIGVWLALHVAPITSRPIDQHIGFATTSDGVRIAYATTGTGTPLVLVIGWFTHLKDGLGSPSYDSAGYIRWYSRDHLVVRYDGRGFGLSERDVSDFSLDARVRDLEAVVDALGLQRFALCAMSAGGPTSITYVDRHPERVSRLVLLASYMNSSFLRAADPKWIERFAGFHRMFNFARTDWDQPAARAAVIEWMHPKASEVERRVLMALARTAADGPAIAEFSSVSIDAGDAARRIRIPTLAVAGSEDSEFPVEAMSQVAAAIPGARFELIEGADHFETIGTDPRVMQLVSSFLAEDVP